MLPLKNRLGRENFQLLFKKGRRVNFDFFTVVYSNQEVFKKNKFGIVVSSAVSKKSVLRNKLKRKVRVIVLKLSESFNSPRGIIIIFKKQASFLPFCELTRELANAFLKLGF